jgi:hypothetical protein
VRPLLAHQFKHPAAACPRFSFEEEDLDLFLVNVCSQRFIKLKHVCCRE